jgi:hypothetical protein
LWALHSSQEIECVISSLDGSAAEAVSLMMKYGQLWAAAHLTHVLKLAGVFRVRPCAVARAPDTHSLTHKHTHTHTHTPQLSIVPCRMQESDREWPVWGCGWCDHLLLEFAASLRVHPSLWHVAVRCDAAAEQFCFYRRDGCPQICGPD